MKTVTVALLILLTNTAAFAEQIPADQAPPLHKSSRKIWIGAGLAGAGAFILPITATRTPNQSPATAVVGVGFIGVGSGLIWLGTQERRRAMLPQTTVDVFLGPRNGIQIRRAW